MHEGRVIAALAEPEPPAAVQRRRAPDGLALLFAVALAIVVVALVPRPLSPDVSGQLWVAHHLRHGARLYADIDEINPPLWFWMAVPVDWLADVLGIGAERVMVAAVCVATIASLLATDRLLDGFAPARRRALLGYAMLILLIMPVRDIAQREQLALIGALPYLALVAARRESRAVSPLLALLIGLGAAAGFALKHYFIGVPLLLELWLAAGLRRSWRPLRPETLALAGAGLLYAAAILIVTPTYLTAVVPELRIAYGATGANALAAMFGLPQLVWLATFAAMVPQHRLWRGRGAPLASALLAAALGFAVAWAIQHKGWPYQGLAVTGCLALAFAALLAEAWERIVLPVRLVAAAVLLLPLGLTLPLTSPPPIDADADIAPALADLHPGDAFGLISNEGATHWPSTIGRGLRLSSRYGRYWMLPAIDTGGSDPRIMRFAQEVVRRTVIDYRCLPPRRIIFLRPVPGPDAPASYDPLRYFLRYPDFAGLLLGHYRRVMRYGTIDAWEIRTTLPQISAATCRRGV